MPAVELPRLNKGTGRYEIYSDGQLRGLASTEEEAYIIYNELRGNTPRKLYLCGECARIMADGYKLFDLPGKSYQRTPKPCELCRKKRYGTTYNVYRRST